MMPAARSRLRSQGPWLAIGLGAIGLGSWLHAAAFRADPIAPGGTRHGLVLGALAAALVLLASLLGVRRRLVSLPVGPLRSSAGWLRAHLWLGGLALVLSLLHAGPHVRGPLGVAMLIVLGLVSASGVVGVCLQRALPGTIDALVETGSADGARLVPGLRRWLHAWLLFHVPISLALLVLVAVHAIAALRY